MSGMVGRRVGGGNTCGSVSGRMGRADWEGANEGPEGMYTSRSGGEKT